MRNLENNEQKTFLISRTDGIGDVVLTLPLAGVIKSYFPAAKVIFLCRKYTKAVVECCTDIDIILDWDELFRQGDCGINTLQTNKIDVVLHIFPRKEIARVCKKAGIKTRIGTSHRLFNWLFCNHLPNFSRKNSNLHESVLNLFLLKPLASSVRNIDFENIQKYLHFRVLNKYDNYGGTSVDKNLFNLILHPKSKGSAREWGLENFKKLIGLLDKNRFRIFLCGTEEEGKDFRKYLIEDTHDNVFDLSGKLSLEEYIALINESDGLVAASTGPLHIAGALNKHAIGLFPPIRPMNPERWRPFGTNTRIFCKQTVCNKCRKSAICECMESISAKQIAEYLSRCYRL